MPEEINQSDRFSGIPADAVEKGKAKMIENLFEAAVGKEIDAAYVLNWIPEQEGIARVAKARIDGLETDIKNLEEGPESHKRENRDMVKFKKQQIEQSQAEIKTAEASIVDYKQRSEVSMKTVEEYKKKVEFVKGL